MRISVYGADRAGIIAMVTKVLSEVGLDILDLESDVAGSDEQPLYILHIEGHATEGFDAIEAALELVDAVDDFNRTHPDTPLPTRVGVHVGKDMTLQWMGLSFVANGFDVNVTQRIESLNNDLKMVGILVSQQVIDGFDIYLYRNLGRFHLVGMSEPLEICELMCRMTEADVIRKESVTAWAGALAVYCSRRWDEAITFFEAFETAYGKDGPCRFYIEQCRQYKTNPPPDSWDGVVRLANN